ncbi:PREDICTED: putative F-box protein At1g67390 [Camelina sativa]|uniref:F-box protein At1g67390 n=1 Tax=Camelina sativa TaxID=90675 RepID=A0ABM0T0Q8_CAMSA|nr:PREDICTED: putative F-box protein At1g67390 [Camelina sativa]
MGCFTLSTLKNFRFHRRSKLTNNASLSSGARDKQTLVDTVDRISELPNDVLAMILSVMATKDVVKTSVLSKRWKNVWKEVPYLSFDMRKATVTNMDHPIAHSARVAKTITKVINNHNVHLEGCTIKHDDYQCHNGVLETWIRLLTLQKHTRALSLINLDANARGVNPFPFSPKIFSHPDLETLWLCLYDLNTPVPFYRCHNLMILKLDKISTEVDVLNTVIASCPSLKVLVLDVMWDNGRACLKIRNNNLKLLHVACSNVDRIEVHAPLLDIFSLDYHFDDAQCNVVIYAPSLLFTTNYGPNLGRVQTMVYNISCKARELENLGDEFLVHKAANFYQQHKYLAVAVDVMNWKEVEMLRNVLVAWNGIKKGFFILFKDKSVSKEEGESSIGGTQEEKWVENLFRNVDFSVESVRMYKFSGSNKRQFAIASRFITQGTVTKKIMFLTSSVPEKVKLDTEAAVAKLMELPKGNENLDIGYF